MPKFDMETIANLQNETSVVDTINANFQLVEDALDDALFREGTAGTETDNAMDVDLDMNAKRILNLPAPVDDLEPARHGDIQTYVDDAEAAQLAAETAQGLAEAAQTAAEQAETNAETAEANAEAAEAGAQDLLDEINTLGVNSGSYTPVSLGTPTGTITPEPADGSLQTATNGGIFTIAAPTGTGWYRLVWQNSASAGIVTLSGFDVTFDEDTSLEHTVEDSIIELQVVNDGIASVAQVTILVDATP
jgi:hypothetical protein